ncbi:hypothetical protein EYF80_017643 [Liparis tanakae]|uniref:Uncharacterized protein n=1 Tax=Liparis tanakae TaxID=230148 RepID=A0A4Z2I1V9_9TELE|nr:hypothetical protein EYF80_017643 [Liparis tanakae]
MLCWRCEAKNETKPPEANANVSLSIRPHAEGLLLSPNAQLYLAGGFSLFLSLGVVESVACWSGEADHRNMLPPCLTADFSDNHMWRDTNA